MSIITSEISSRTGVLAAGQDTKGYFSPLQRGSQCLSNTPGSPNKHNPDANSATCTVSALH